MDAYKVALVAYLLLLARAPFYVFVVSCVVLVCCCVDRRTMAWRGVL